MGRPSLSGRRLLAFVVAVATIQLLMRNRYREHVFSHALDMSRKARGLPPLDWPDLAEEIAAERNDGYGHDLHWRHPWLLRLARHPGWKTWTVVFVAFMALDVVVIVATLT